MVHLFLNLFPPRISHYTYKSNKMAASKTNYYRLKLSKTAARTCGSAAKTKCIDSVRRSKFYTTSALNAPKYTASFGPLKPIVYARHGRDLMG